MTKPKNILNKKTYIDKDGYRTYPDENGFVHCDCGIKTPSYSAIDLWCIVNEKFYCYTCQKENEIGWFERVK